MSNVTKFIDNRQFHKRNYEKALEYIIPKVYYETDYALDLKDISPIDQIINSHINVIQNFSSIIPINPVPGTIYSSINTPSGIAQYFVKQNNLTDIDINDFERKILIPLGKAFSDFKFSSDFSEYVLETLLPGIRLNSPTLDFLEGGAVSANHVYLITNLSWLYFLNFSNSVSVSYNPSAYVHDLIVNKIFNNQNVLINDAMKGLTECLWRNYSTKLTWREKKVIPDEFRPPQYTQDDIYTSGTQQLEKLKTLIDVVYSPLYIDNSDTKVKYAIEDYLQNGYKIIEKNYEGPLINLVKGIGYSFADYSNNVDLLETLYDLDKCPDQYLPQLAKLIGWRLFGSEPERWRLQIANAVNVYKRIGTKQSIQFAADSVFAQDVFDVSSKIYEMWESYIPHLIYYALATESVLLKDFYTWDRQLANTLLNSTTYSTSSMDDNIRLCTDEIIYQVVKEFSGHFRLGGNPFPLDDPNFVFNYRGRIFPIPPFEEYPYYVDTHVNNDMIDSIVDKLVCFGVPQPFAIEVGDYMKQNTLFAYDLMRFDNTWLMFTSGAEYPPNWEEVIRDVTNKRSEYLPLWNGKSSHFKLIFEASSFDFAKNSLEGYTSESLKIASEIVTEFAPAHAVPEVLASLSSTDDYYTSAVEFPYIQLDFPDQSQLNYSSGTILAGYGMSAMAMPTYKRVIGSSLEVFYRGDVDSIADPLLSPSGTVVILPRRHHRRRNFKFTLPKDGFYTKTGFNMPVSFENRNRSYSVTSAGDLEYVTIINSALDVYLPLGLIPSSQSYVPIPDYDNIHPIYNFCESLNSSSVYSGLVVSTTFPARGWRRVESNAKTTEYGIRPDKYYDLGQLNPLVATMHYIMEEAKLLQASSYYSKNLKEYSKNRNWKNNLQSYANSSTEFSGNFPNNFSDYTNFKFGRDFHKLYNEYTHNFKRHRMTPHTMYLDGPTIFGHAFGSVLRNSKFKDDGSFFKFYPQYLTSSIDLPIVLSNNKFPFNASSTASGCYVASTITDGYVEKYEYRNSGVLDHIELCQTMGTSPNNNFTIFRLNKTNRNPNRINPFLYENTIIRQEHVDGFGRLRFDLSRYSNTTSEGYDVEYNFLSPEHDFKFNLKSVIADFQGKLFGGGSVGVWIHTKPEVGKVWTYTRNKEWIQHKVSSPSDISVESIISDYAHMFNFDEVERPLDTSSKFKCLHIENKFDVLNTLTDTDFSDCEIIFNTRNKPILVPDHYFRDVAHQVHRENQKYVIEIFPLIYRGDRCIFYQNVNLLDSTLNRWAKLQIINSETNYKSCDYYCPDNRIELNKSRFLSIIKYFNELAGAYQSKFGYGSRVASYTSGVYETSGGSRINYVQNPAWLSRTTGTTGMLEVLSLVN